MAGAKGPLAAASMQSLELSTKTVQTLLFVVLKWNAGLLLSLATADIPRPYCKLRGTLCYHPWLNMEDADPTPTQ